MKAQHSHIALALAAALIGVSPMAGSADATPTASVAPARAGQGAIVVAESSDVREGHRSDAAAPAADLRDQPRAEDGRAHRNSPHPAVLSFERPVYPIGVPNPPVSLERY